MSRSPDSPNLPLGPASDLILRIIEQQVACRREKVFAVLGMTSDAPTTPGNRVRDGGGGKGRKGRRQKHAIEEIQSFLITGSRGSNKQRKRKRSAPAQPEESDSDESESKKRRVAKEPQIGRGPTPRPTIEISEAEGPALESESIIPSPTSTALELNSLADCEGRLADSPEAETSKEPHHLMDLPDDILRRILSNLVPTNQTLTFQSHINPKREYVYKISNDESDWALETEKVCRGTFDIFSNNQRLSATRSCQALPAMIPGFHMSLILVSRKLTRHIYDLVYGTNTLILVFDHICPHHDYYSPLTLFPSSVLPKVKKMEIKVVTDVSTSWGHNLVKRWLSSLVTATVREGEKLQQAGAVGRGKLHSLNHLRITFEPPYPLQDRLFDIPIGTPVPTDVDYSVYQYCLEPLAGLRGISRVEITDNGASRRGYSPCITEAFARALSGLLMSNWPNGHEIPAQQYEMVSIRRRRPGRRNRETIQKPKSRRFWMPEYNWDAIAETLAVQEDIQTAPARVPT